MRRFASKLVVRMALSCWSSDGVFEPILWKGGNAACSTFCGPQMGSLLFAMLHQSVAILWSVGTSGQAFFLSIQTTKTAKTPNGCGFLRFLRLPVSPFMHFMAGSHCRTSSVTLRWCGAQRWDWAELSRGRFGWVDMFKWIACPNILRGLFTGVRGAFASLSPKSFRYLCAGGMLSSKFTCPRRRRLSFLAQRCCKV